MDGWPESEGIGRMLGTGDATEPGSGRGDAAQLLRARGDALTIFLITADLAVWAAASTMLVSRGL